jgi:phospholipase/carboxylesterase
MRTTIAGLDVQVLQGGPEAPSAAAVLCHGFGAPGDDLVPLFDELLSREPALSRTRFYFPAAPLELDGWGDARAWWDLDLEAIQRLAGDPGALREFRRQEPPGMPQARAAMLKLVKDVADANALPFGRLTLGGFSQGAMIATDVALRLEEAPQGLAILSGTLLLEDTWRAKAKARAGLRVFQAHGRQDPVLSFQAAEALRDLWLDAQAKLEFLPFDGGHTITGEALTRLARFLVGA